ATERVGEILAAVADHLETCEWTVEAVDLRPVLEKVDVKPRKGLPAVYAAVEGTHAGLPLFDSIVLLGRERSVRRVRAAIELVGQCAATRWRRRVGPPPAGSGWWRTMVGSSRLVMRGSSVRRGRFG